MEWSDVRIVLAAARSGTLGGAAARALHLSHPTIGRRLQAMEHATGQMLFQRTAGGLVLTEDGAAVLSLAEHMEDGALAMDRRLAGQEQKPQGSLRISCRLVWRLCPAADCRRHVSVEIFTAARLFNLAQREADIAFRIVPSDTPDIVQPRLTWLPYGAYVAADTPEPEYGDEPGFWLITHDTSIGQFPDIAWR